LSFAVSATSTLSPAASRKMDSGRTVVEVPRADFFKGLQRDTKEVLAELVGKLKEKLDPKKFAATSAGEKHKRGEAITRAQIPFAKHPCPRFDKRTRHTLIPSKRFSR
jgi:hypothetical protein